MFPQTYITAYVLLHLVLYNCAWLQMDKPCDTVLMAGNRPTTRARQETCGQWKCMVSSLTQRESNEKASFALSSGLHSQIYSPIVLIFPRKYFYHPRKYFCHPMGWDHVVKITSSIKRGGRQQSSSWQSKSYKKQVWKICGNGGTAFPWTFHPLPQW